MTPRIQKAINVLLDAINNGTLKKGSCRYCAVGNLIREAGVRESDVSKWGMLFSTHNETQVINTISPENRKKAIETIKQTDFTQEELMQIEYAFETNTEIHFLYYRHSTKEQIKQDQIKGLEAVVEVMLGFDNIKENVKEVFTEKVMV